MQAEYKVGHLSPLVHLLVGLNDHGDEHLHVRLSRSHHLLQPRVETKVADVLFLTSALAVHVSNARLDKLHNKQNIKFDISLS